MTASGDKALAEAAVMELLGYVAGQLEERRSAPKDNDMLSSILAITVDDAPISMEAATRWLLDLAVVTK